MKLDVQTIPTTASSTEWFTILPAGALTLALVEVSVLILKSEQKKVVANLIILNFGNFLKVTVQDGLTPILKGKIEVINPLAEKQEAKGLISLMTKSSEIMWADPDIFNDKQWDSSQPKLKGKSYNVISLTGR